MMRKSSVAAAAVLFVAMTTGARSDETGLASIHEWRKEGGRTCMSDHFHYGSGKGASRQRALADAVSSWRSFTDLEYGSTWASWNRAASKAVKCAQGGSSWSCDVEARPCRGK